MTLHRLDRPGGGRLSRMTGTVRAAYRAARRIDADLYHLHDPELIPIGLVLRAAGKTVVYDAHEHLPQQILTKPWVPPRARQPLAWATDVGERLAARLLSAVVTAEPYVRERFEGPAARAVTVGNYPMLAEFPAGGNRPGTERVVCYVGEITELRGVREMIAAAARVDATLLLAGRFAPAELEQELAEEPGWDCVEVLGQLDRRGVAATMQRSRAGLVVLRPVPNYLEANPTKMFEYMSAGIPVIASNFPSWSTIVTTHGCGLCVDPTSPEEIARAIEWILSNPDAARTMGVNGRRAAEEQFNWETERMTLIELYRELVGPA